MFEKGPLTHIGYSKLLKKEKLHVLKSQGA